MNHEAIKKAAKKYAKEHVTRSFWNAESVPPEVLEVCIKCGVEDFTAGALSKEARDYWIRIGFEAATHFEFSEELNTFIRKFETAEDFLKTLDEEKS